MDPSCVTKEKCIATILTNVEKGIRDWFTIVETFGMDNDDMKKWQEDLQGEFEACITDCNQIAQEKQQALVKKMELLLQKSQDLCKTLSIKMPQFTSTNQGLYSDEQYLIEQIKVWQDEITLRSADLEVLKSRRDEICKTLGSNNSFVIKENPLPSREEMTVYLTKIGELEAEREHRMLKFLSLQRDIALLAMELEFTPSLTFEKNIVYGHDFEEFQLSDENMSRVSELFEELTKKRENIEHDLLKLRENLQHLWKILEEDVQYCNDFIQENDGNNYKTLDAFKREVKRCEEMRKANLKIFIVKLRKELIELWDEAGYPEAKREDFQYHMEDDLYTEDLLTLHDFQIEKVKQHINDNQKVYELLKQRETYYAKMRDLEKRECAPDRFKNRGGQLLKEEKERKAVAKKIPLIEDQLLELAVAYEMEHGEKFVYGNDTIETLIARDREHLEQEKQLLLSARKQKRDMTINAPKGTPMSLGRSRNATHLTTNRLALTPYNTRTPLRTTPRTAPVKKLLVPRLSITKAKRRLSTDKKKRIAAIRSKVQQPSLHNDVDYSEFENEISKREAFRSTISIQSPHLNRNKLNPIIKIDTPQTVERTLKPAISKMKLIF